MPTCAYAICADAIADAIDELAAVFYRDHQFQPLVSRPQSLFLPMKTALALVSGQGTSGQRAPKESPKSQFVLYEQFRVASQACWPDFTLF